MPERGIITLKRRELSVNPDRARRFQGRWGGSRGQSLEPSSGRERSTNRTLSLSIQNASGRLRIVMLEPGAEFLLTVDEKLEVTARGGSAEVGLRLVESSNRTVVFVEGCSGSV